MSDKCIRCDWGTAMGTAYCAPCLAILVSLERGEQPTVDDPLDAPPERAILQDLIEEQRELHHRMGGFCSLCSKEWPCQCVQSLERAETKLRVVLDD